MEGNARMTEMSPEYKAKAIKRFMAKVEIDRETDCWLWQGQIDRKGYGRFRFLGKKRQAHRVAHRLFGEGPVPDGLDAAHICGPGRRHCVSPEHTFPNTRKENLADSALHHGGKTHCPKGHPYSPEKTYWRPSGRRGCKICAAGYSARYRAKKAAAEHGAARLQ